MHCQLTVIVVGGVGSLLHYQAAGMKRIGSEAVSSAQDRRDIETAHTIIGNGSGTRDCHPDQKAEENYSYDAARNPTHLDALYSLLY